MRIYATLIYIFLYAPIALIVGLSFNAGKQSMVWTGFSVEWYGKAFSNPLITEALGTSVMIGLATARAVRHFRHHGGAGAGAHQGLGAGAV